MALDGYTLARSRVVEDEDGTPWLVQVWVHKAARIVVRTVRRA